MKLANYRGRAIILTERGGTDIATASSGQFGPDPMSIFDHWDEFTEWAKQTNLETTPIDSSQLGCPIPQPRQVFAIGLNYRSHAEESGMPLPTTPATFTKFPTCLTGPFDEVVLDCAMADWEVELVAVIGREADRVPESEGWSHIAGLTIGQDISDRNLQFAAGAQFSLGKSRRGYGPMGPHIVTVDEFENPDGLGLGCSVNGEVVQEGNTADLVFTVPQLVAELSAITTLLPGDIIFTGTPSGVGIAHQPPRFLEPGAVLESWIEGIGTIRNVCR